MRCKRCGTIMTWAANKRQFGRLLHRGVAESDAKDILPSCQKCNTILLRNKEKHEIPS
jgi:hypothetical protein